MVGHSGESLLQLYDLVITTDKSFFIKKKKKQKKLLKICQTNLWNVTIEWSAVYFSNEKTVV